LAFRRRSGAVGSSSECDWIYDSGVELSLLNHASVRLHGDNLDLVTDPWFEGTAFNDGWSLVFDTPPEARELLRHSSQIWLSHEHPDHFSPQTLLQIPPKERADHEILYQETRDKKVKSWCSEVGFSCRELPHNVWTYINPTTRVMLGTIPFDDSWLALQNSGVTVLNLNDCVLDVEALLRIRDAIGEVNVLLSQYSYAGWLGNPENVDARRDGASKVLSRLRTQVEILRPDFTLPFASAIYFGHSENRYLNDERNSLRNAFDALCDLPTKAICLTPGETWHLGDTHDNLKSLAIFDWANDLTNKSFVSSAPVTFSELLKAFSQYTARIKNRNNRLLLRIATLRGIGVIPTVRLWLTDLEMWVEFNVVRGLTQLKSKPKSVDAEISSECLNFLLTKDFGIDTLMVNGRLIAGTKGLTPLIRAFGIGKLNNSGRIIGFRLLLDLGYLRAIFRHPGFHSTTKRKPQQELGVRT